MQVIFFLLFFFFFYLFIFEGDSMSFIAISLTKNYEITHLLRERVFSSCFTSCNAGKTQLKNYIEMKTTTKNFFLGNLNHILSTAAL